VTAPFTSDISDGIDPAASTGRLMLNMLATLAEYERELIIERVNAGIAAARRKGTRFGRTVSDPAVIADKLAIGQDARSKGRTAEDAARLVGWSRATLYRTSKPSLRARTAPCRCWRTAGDEGRLTRCSTVLRRAAQPIPCVGPSWFAEEPADIGTARPGIGSAA
jgi:hypothetical protein